MSTLRVHKGMSLSDFLAWEARQECRHELIDGETVAMTGGTSAHNLLTRQCANALDGQLRPRGCRVYTESMKVPARGNIFYPDVVATCTAVGNQDLLVPEPTIIVEVLSESTAERDLTRKLKAYLALATLQAYVVVSQEVVLVRVHARAADGTWAQPVDYEDFSAPARLPLGLELDLAGLYRDVLPAPDGAPASLTP